MMMSWTTGNSKKCLWYQNKFMMSSWEWVKDGSLCIVGKCSSVGSLWSGHCCAIRNLLSWINKSCCIGYNRWCWRLFCLITSFTKHLLVSLKRSHCLWFCNSNMMRLFSHIKCPHCGHTVHLIHITVHNAGKRFNNSRARLKIALWKLTQADNCWG